MKPELEKIPERAKSSFLAKVVVRESRPLLKKAWHYHPEIEICYTKKSHGKLFIGNNIYDYAESDLVMFGSNLPHAFTTDEKCEQVIIQMNADFLGKEFLEKPEMGAVLALFNDAKKGLKFYGKTKTRCERIIKNLMGSTELTQLIYLLELLHCLANSKEVNALCSDEFIESFNETNLNKIKRVYDHVIDTFIEDSRIEDVAAKFNLSEAGFYKFIKRHTKKTYTQIINEFRINNASKLLVTTDKHIAEIAFQSGFKNLSYFNRRFKAMMKNTPQEFRELNGKLSKAKHKRS